MELKLISSRMTFFNKRIFPILWFGILGLMLAIMVYVPIALNKPWPPMIFFILPVILAIFGFAFMKHMIFDLADEAYDGGDFILVKFGRDEERIPLSNVVNVSFSNMTNPKKVTLTLREKSRFGNEVSFSPAMDSLFKPFQKSAIVEDLIRRIDEKRVKTQSSR